MQVKKKSPLLVSRDNLRNRARAVIREELLEGRITGRVNESQLSAEVGVSRTPLREALLGLEKEGLVIAKPWRGFYAVPLSAQEVREMYPILWTLESLALRLRGIPTAAELTALARINDRLESKLREPALALKLDTEWHATLLRRCANTRLLEMIRHQKQTAYRYEYAYMQEARRVVVSVGQHREILTALREGDLNRAVTTLEENWRVTLEITESWVMKRGEGVGESEPLENWSS